MKFSCTKVDPLKCVVYYGKLVSTKTQTVFGRNDNKRDSFPISKNRLRNVSFFVRAKIVIQSITLINYDIHYTRINVDKSDIIK